MAQDIPGSFSSKYPLGSSVPEFTAHAISVSLPTWKDNVGYEEGDKRVLNAMVTGYPRFFIHKSIEKLVRICEHKFGAQGERCMLFASTKVAEHCRTFMLDRASGTPPNIRLIYFLICPEDKNTKADSDCNNGSGPSKIAHGTCVDLHIVLFPATEFSFAKQFWQHSGLGISSRLAEHCLHMLPEAESNKHARTPSWPTVARFLPKALNKRYSATGRSNSPFPKDFQSPKENPKTEHDDSLNENYNVYVEERYGRNMPLALGGSAKRALRRRIAGVLVQDDSRSSPEHSESSNPQFGPSSRGVADLDEGDVFLFPTGMSAIWSAHNLVLSVRKPAKSICFGFPYGDTLSVLRKWGPGCHFFGHGRDTDIDDLEALLQRESTTPGTPPISALFTEFPSNPLLRSGNLPRLRLLADKYDFMLVIDETVGNFVNVQVLPFADIVVSSLTKVFSGESNVMGGSLVLNPRGRHYAALKAHLLNTFEDLYYNEDAIYMERNSRNFRQRIRRIDANASSVCEFLRSCSVAAGVAGAVVKEVFYPKWQTRANYDICRVSRKPVEEEDDDEENTGFGGLFSLTFTSIAASRAFYDALPCYKGPSLGTNFTLACPYTILVHYTELPWAAEYGVEEGLVRVSVGIEERDVLLAAFGEAVRAAERAQGGEAS